MAGNGPSPCQSLIRALLPLDRVLMHIIWAGPQSNPAAQNITAQWHTLSYLGPQWAAPGLCQCCELRACCQPTCAGCDPINASFVGAYTRAVNARGAVLTVDLQLLRNGSMNGQQVQTLRAAWDSPYHSPGAGDEEATGWAH